MIDLIVLIVFCTLLAYVIQNRTFQYDLAISGIAHDNFSKVLYFIILVAFILFAGLRSTYNDTSAYMHGYELIDASSINWLTILDPYGGFELYQLLIKHYISENPQVFIFITAVITNLLFISFYTRYTYKFCGTIYMYAIGLFIFSMAGIKQTIAIAIALYAIGKYLNRRYLSAIILLLFAMTFHPYIICFICIPLLKGKIWSKNTLIIIFVCFIAFLNMDDVISLFKLIGQEYSQEAFDDYTINPIRVMVEAIPVVISFIYKREINKTENPILLMGVNMEIISFMFIAMGLFMNPIYIGRMSTYFTALSAIAIPEMLAVCWGNSKQKRILIIGYYVFFFIYFIMDMTKIGTISMFIDRFNHVAINTLF